MPFSVVTGESFSHWADTAAAIAWFAEANRLTADAAVAALDESGDWNRQRTMMFAAYAAVGNAYRSMNLQPVTDPEFRAAWHEQFGNPIRGQNVAFPVPQLHEDVIPTVGGVVGSAALDQLESRFRGETAWVRFRLWINPTTGAVGASCLERPDSGQDGCDFPDVWCPGVQAMPPPRYTWICSAANRPLIGRHEVLPPLRFFLPFVQRLARAGVRRGPMGVLSEARAFVRQRNAQTVSDGGSLEQTEQLATELLRRAQGGVMSAADPATRTIWQGMRTAAAINPISAAAAAVVDAIMGFLPAATGYWTDEFGRVKASTGNNYEVPYIALGRSASDPPRIQIPPAPMSGIQMATYGLPNLEQLLQYTQSTVQDPASNVSRHRVESESGPWFTEKRKKLIGMGLLGFAGFLAYDRFWRK